MHSEQDPKNPHLRLGEQRHEGAVDRPTRRPAAPDRQGFPVIERVVRALEGIASGVQRLADHVAPQPRSNVGTQYIAQRLGCTTTWVAEMVRSGEIPSGCIVQGTGNGKPWKFYRGRVDEWLASR